MRMLVMQAQKGWIKSTLKEAMLCIDTTAEDAVFVRREMDEMQAK